MPTQLIVGLVLTALIVLYVYLKRTKGHKESNLPAVSMSNPPAVSEDINLPMVSEDVTFPPANNLNPPIIKNDLENKGSQQQ